MAFCKNCGQQMDDNATFCASCGTPVDTAAQQNFQQNYQQAPVQPQATNVDSDVQRNRGIAWLAYVGLLLLIPLFARKRSPYCQYHVKQGATLLAVVLAYQIAKSILLTVIDAATGGYVFYGIRFHSTAYTIFDILFWGGSIFLLVIAIIGVVNAASGKMKELPLIGKIPFIALLMDKIYAAMNK